MGDHLVFAAHSPPLSTYVAMSETHSSKNRIDILTSHSCSITHVKRQSLVPPSWAFHKSQQSGTHCSAAKGLGVQLSLLRASVKQPIRYHISELHIRAEPCWEQYNRQPFIKVIHSVKDGQHWIWPVSPHWLLCYSSFYRKTFQMDFFKTQMYLFSCASLNLHCWKCFCSILF